MLYLRTGANGTCKTLFTLRDVRDMQLAENRPVCTNGRFKMKPEVMEEFGWRVIKFEEWWDQPDGTIFLMDECHNDLPLRANSAPVPKHVAQIAEHRSRGMDFFLLTQHPMNIDAFVRKLIGSPGWHQHLKRVFGGLNVTRVLQWDAVRSDCEKDGSGKSAQITTRKQPKEVYDWYDSATLHTAKVRIPVKAWVLLFCVIFIPLMIWLSIRSINKFAAPPPAPAVSQNAIGAVNAAPGSGGTERHTMTTPEYLASFAPRVDGFQHTAPRYDQVTQPTQAPYPAACMEMKGVCKCYTTQATLLPTPEDLCRQIVKGGFFMDWKASETAQTVDKRVYSGVPPPPMPSGAPSPAEAYKASMPSS